MTVKFRKRLGFSDEEGNDNDLVLRIPKVKRAREDEGACASVPRTGCDVSLQVLASQDGLIVQVIPPRQLIDEHLDHVPCDIVLVIDVSSSMDDPAPAPPRKNGETGEQTGMSILDLTKHAANTIIKTLDAHDRLAIVTFSTKFKILLELVSMSPKNKETAWREIKSMKPAGTTNLWDGIKAGLRQFEVDPHNKNHLENVRAMMLLTDGQPHGVGAIPPEGYVPAMRRLGKLPANIHTFGFGYFLQPGLLPSIAEVSGGKYSFIPDSSMLGTVFIHAVANLQSTFAQQAVLTLEYPLFLELEEIRIYINKGNPIRVKSGTKAWMEYTINLSNIQYGQTRVIYLSSKCRSEVLAKAKTEGDLTLDVRVTLKYRHGRDWYQETADGNIRNDITRLSPSEIAYHVSRAQMIGFLSRLSPLDRQAEHKPLKRDRLPKFDDLKHLLETLPANQTEHLGDRRNCALVQDLNGDDTADGQVNLALRTEPNQDYWGKWGQHYLPSLAGAHACQMRMSFTDPGTQFYGADSPLFLERLDVLNNAFDTLSPPEPSHYPSLSDDDPPSYSLVATPVVDMSMYNNVQGSCFAGQTRVLLAPPPGDSLGDEKEEGEKQKTIAIQQLRAGMDVQTLRGPRTVRIVLKCHTDLMAGREMWKLPTNEGTSLWVTPWHPVSLNNGRTWVFPADAFPADTYPTVRTFGFKEPVYAVQLQQKTDDDHADAHAINVDGVWGATMGHGLVEPGKAAQERDARNHHFYGDYDAVATELDALPKGLDDLALCNGTIRNAGTAVSFIPDITSRRYWAVHRLPC